MTPATSVKEVTIEGRRLFEIGQPNRTCLLNGIKCVWLADCAINGVRSKDNLCKGRPVIFWTLEQYQEHLTKRLLGDL